MTRHHSRPQYDRLELVQMVTALIAFGGHIADVNDWMTNVVGGAVGYGLFVAMTRSKPLAGFVQRFRWPTRERSSSVDDPTL